MRTRVERINPYLFVRDISESVRYYVEILGFEPYINIPNLGIVECDGHQVHFIKKTGDGITTQRIWIGVEDIGVLYAQFMENGAQLFQEPTNFSWAYQMILQDPDGNPLIFGSELKHDEPYQDLVVTNE